MTMRDGAQPGFRFTPRPRRRFGARWLVCAAGCAAAWWLAAASVIAAQPSGNGATGASWSNDASTLREPSSTAASRLSSAKRLVASPDALAHTLVLELLKSPDTPGDVRDSLAAAIAQTVVSPSWAFEAVVDLLERAPANKQPDWLACLGAIRTRDSVRMLLKYADPAKPAPVKGAAFTAVTRLSGQTSLGDDLTKWNEWFAGVEWIPEIEWQRVLTEGQARYALNLETQRDAAIRRLIESERRRFVDTKSEADRAAILAAQLRDEFPAVRRLGVELANRELANARIPGGDAPAAALAILADSFPDLRAAGADLVERLRPEGAASAIAVRVRREQDPSVLPALIRAAKRWPAVEIRDCLLAWLDPASPVVGESLEALDAMEHAGLLTSNEDRQRVLEAIRRRASTVTNGAGAGGVTGTLRLRCVLGDASDRLAVAKVLEDSDAAKRLAAAQALSNDSASLDAVVNSARRDDALVGIAAGMIARYKPGLEGCKLLLSLPTPRGGTPGARNPSRDALQSLADDLRPAELLSLAASVEDLDLRESLLARFMTIPLGSSAVPSLRRDAFRDLVCAIGLTRLAETSLTLNKPGAALAAIKRLEDARVPTATSIIMTLKVRALLIANRVADAIELDAPAESWIVALKAIVDMPHAPSVLRVLEANFSGTFSASEDEALGALRLLVSERHSVSEGKPNGR